MGITGTMANSEHQTVLGELETLVRETYLLWDEDWVGFSWRNYTFDHVQRVRGLARTICAREGGDVLAVDYAGLLHDITKSYDGEIVMKEGKRVLDENGFWKNEVLPPARQNRVTELYDRLGLAGTLHNVSGARLADALLEEHGLSTELRSRVAGVIALHLKPHEAASVEGKALYDADTIDANIGLPAFYRNIQISLHFQERQFAQQSKSLDDYLRDSLAEYLNPYLREKIPAWIASKHTDFTTKMTTAAGRQIASERIDRLGALIGQAAEELADFDAYIGQGRLGVIRHFMLNRRNPALSTELAYLTNGWHHEARPTEGAKAFVAAIRSEAEGTC